MYDHVNVVKLGWNDYAQKNFGDRDLSQEIEHLSIFENILGKKSNILDVGCGTGKPVIGYFLSKNHNICGVDISKKQLEKAINNFPGVTFHEGDVFGFLTQNQKYDAIICLNSIEYIQRERHIDLLKLFYQSLVENGKLLINHPIDQNDKIIPFAGDSQMYVSHFNPDGFEEFTVKSKFNQIYKKLGDGKYFYILTKHQDAQKHSFIHI